METVDIVDIVDESIFLKNLEKFPYLAEKNPLDLPSCFFEEEMYSLNEFREFMIKTAYERFGIKLDLPVE